MARERLSFAAHALRVLHNVIGFGELTCLGYVWVCALTRRRDRWLGLSVGVLAGEGVALLMAKGCPLGFFQRRVGDEVPMFELRFGPRLAPFAIPALTALGSHGGGCCDRSPTSCLREARCSVDTDRLTVRTTNASTFVAPVALP